MKTYNFELSNQSYASQVMKKSKADGISLFLLDNNAHQSPVHFLYHKHLAPELLESYSTTLYQYDPLTPHKKSLLHRCASYTGINVKGAASIDGAYWQYFKCQGFRETASSFRAISNNIYMVVGLNLTTRSRHLCVESAMKDMESWLKDSCEFIIESSVRGFCNRADSTPSAMNLDTLSNLLTNREFQVVCMVLQGYSNKEIATKLTLSEYTIENYLGRVYKKLNVRGRTSLLAMMVGSHEPKPDSGVLKSRSSVR